MWLKLGMSETFTKTLKTVLVLLFFSEQSLATTKKLISYDLDWPPYLISESTDSNLQGLGKDIINQCTSEQGYQTSYLHLPIKRIVVFMQSGQIDLSIYSYKKHREAFLTYAKVPIFETEVGFVVRKDSNISIDSLEDLAPLRMGHLAGLTHTPELLAIINHKRLTGELSEGHHLDAMFAQLLSSTPRFDIMPDSKQTFYWRAKQLNIQDKIKVLPFVAGKKEYFISVSKKSKNINNIEAFLAQFDHCILNMHNNGQYQKLLQKYHLQPVI
ncbi:substrate-binding periplasmic protein [Paraglaciecola aestuariivivens]